MSKTHINILLIMLAIGGFAVFLFVDSPSELRNIIHKETPDTPTFTNVTKELGIEFTQHDYGDDAPGSIWYMTGGVAAGDYNNDGWTDLYVAKVDGKDALFENKNGKSFENVADKVGLTDDLLTNSASWGDIDHDGDLDLFLSTGNDRRYYLYINNGEDGFSEESEARGIVVDDGQTKFGFSATFVDYDNDGFLDLHTTGWALATSSKSSSRLFRNLGGDQVGFFEDVTVDAGLVLDDHFSFTSRFVDLDMDSILDLVIVSDFSNSKLFWGNNDGTFTDGTEEANFGTEENGMGIAIQDYDYDGIPDIFITSVFDSNNTCEDSVCKWGTTGNRLYKNNGNRSFSDLTDAAGLRDGGWGWASNFFDYDNDGDLDVIMGNGIYIPDTELENPYNDHYMRLWQNNGNGFFTDVTKEAQILNQEPSMGVVQLDYDNDGDLDLFVVNNGGEPILYRNNLNDQNNYIRVRLENEPDGMPNTNIKVSIENEDAPTQTYEINGGNNYLSQSESVAHFGIKDRESVDIITITWQDGHIQTYENITANTTLEVRREE